MDLRSERVLHNFTVGVGHMSPGSKPPKPPKRKFWIRLGAATFYLFSVLFLTWLHPFIAPLTFVVLIPIYLVVVQLGFRRLRAIETAQAKADASDHLGLLGQQSQCQTREQYELSEEYQSELLMRKFETAVSVGFTALSISLFYEVMPQPVRVLMVPLLIVVAFYTCNSIRR